MVIILSVIFALSGAAGLVYESIWTRYLGLFVGHSAYAQVLVLIIFLGGMSAGALLVGRRAERVRDPLRRYALVELAVGLIGLAFHDVFVWITHVAYDTLFPALGPGALHSLGKWTIAALLILPQSVLLGATFPLMTAGALRLRADRDGQVVALLYFANSIGAAIGVLLAGFVLIAAVGLPGTILVAAMTNIVVAGVVFLGARPAGTAGVTASTQMALPLERRAVDDDVSPALHRLLLAVSFATAVSSFMYEIGWIRMLSLVLGSATHSFELMLSAFIFGLAIGAFLIRRRGAMHEGLLGRLASVQLVMGVLAVATLPLYARSFGWMETFMAAFSRTPAGYVAFTGARYLICLAVMLPATICAGMTLPLITYLLMRGERGERALGQVYGVNTLGSIAGVALAALVLLPLLGLKWMIVAGAAIDVGLGLWLLAFDGGLARSAHQWRRLAPALTAGLLLMLVGGATRLDRGMLVSGVFRSGSARAPTVPDVVYFADGRTATVSVRKVPVSKALFLATNGKTDASLGAEWFTPPAARTPFTHDASTQVLLPLVTLAHAPQARVAAVIGQGSGMSSHTLLGDPALRRVVTIEIEPQMLRASRLFYPANRRVFDDARSTFALDDARSYFASQGQRYDLILSEPSNPWVAGVSGLFTTEFYAHVRHFLTPQGVFGQWLHLSELNDGLVLSVVRAVAENFPDYAMYAVSNRDILIVATNRPRLPAPDWSVFKLPGVAEDLRRVVPLTPAMLSALRIVDADALAPLVRDGGANSDFYPTLDLGAERARYIDEDASGFVWMVGERFGIGLLTQRQRVGVVGAPYTPIAGVPRLEAMELASRVRHGQYADASGALLGASERVRAVDRLLASSAAPVDWHVWVGALREADETRSGGAAGVPDTALYAAAARALSRHVAPVEARASVSFLHGLAAWDFDQASRAAEPLLAAARRGDFWLPADLLRDGAVVARLRTGDVRGARAALDALAPASVRPVNDVRAQLLTAWVRDAERPKEATPVTMR